MRDEEIIKALQCCSEPCAECDECPLYCIGANCSSFELQSYALDLINRQKAEIEKLKSENEILSRNADNAFQEGLNECRELFEPEIKVEAYKEFAERLKEKVENVRKKYQRLCREQGEKEDEIIEIHCKGIIKLINNLLKEMVGEEE